MNQATVLPMPTTGLSSIQAVRESLAELETLCQKKIDAAYMFKEACKAVGTKANLEGAVIASFVTARVNDVLEAQERKATQLSFLFESF